MKLRNILIAFLLTASPAWATTEIFTIPGSNTWTKPSTTGTITFRVWASGGNGALLATLGGGGGGGGAYAEYAGFDPTGLNNDYAYVVDTGGSETTVGWYNADFGDICYAEGGKNAVSGNHGNGGDPGNGSGTTQYAGGLGSDDEGTSAGGGGGGAGSGENGHDASTSNGGAGGSPDGGVGGDPGVLSAGQTGTQPGGGGGGALLTSAGAGANGMTSVTYTPSGGGATPNQSQSIIISILDVLPHWAKHEYAIAT